MLREVLVVVVERVKVVEVVKVVKAVKVEKVGRVDEHSTPLFGQPPMEKESFVTIAVKRVILLAAA